MRRSQFHEGEREAHRHRSPYRCNDCAIRFWALSQKMRIRLAVVATVLLIATLITTSVFFLVEEPTKVTAESDDLSTMMIEPDGTVVTTRPAR